MSKTKFWGVCADLSLGAAVGVGLFTFVYAKPDGGRGAQNGLRPPTIREVQG